MDYSLNKLSDQNSWRQSAGLGN